jgi:hypothetical protein
VHIVCCIILSILNLKHWSLYYNRIRLSEPFSCYSEKLTDQKQFTSHVNIFYCSALQHGRSWRALQPLYAWCQYTFCEINYVTDGWGCLYFRTECESKFLLIFSMLFPHLVGTKKSIWLSGSLLLALNENVRKPACNSVKNKFLLAIFHKMLIFCREPVDVTMSHHPLTLVHWRHDIYTTRQSSGVLRESPEAVRELLGLRN